MKKNNKAKLTDLIDKYKKKLGLSHLAIDYFVVDDKHFISEEDEDKSELKKVDYYAEVIKTCPNNFTIIFNKSAFTESDLKNTVVHELLHCVFWGMIENSELIIRTSTELCPAGRDNQVNKLRDEEHEVIEKIIKLVM